MSNGRKSNLIAILNIWRYKWAIPDLKSSNKFLKTWKYPASHPKKRLEDENEEVRHGKEEEGEEVIIIDDNLSII
jgi:hypothetical protein